MYNRTGTYIDPLNFNPSGSCQAGGLYFTDIDHIFDFVDYGDNIATIKIPVNTPVYKDPGNEKWKCKTFNIVRFDTVQEFVLKNNVTHITFNNKLNVLLSLFSDPPAMRGKFAGFAYPNHLVN